MTESSSVCCYYPVRACTSGVKQSLLSVYSQSVSLSVSQSVSLLVTFWS